MAEFAGHLSLRAVPSPDGRTILADQSFRAPFHLSKPYWDAEARVLLIQVVNPTAGILEGDALTTRLSVEPGAALIVTTPGASRVFTMRSGEAVAHQDIRVDAGGWLEMIPEPLVTHRDSSFRQTTRLELAAGASLFYADQWMPGRLGHGEAWAWRRLEIQLEVRLAQQLVWCERMASSGPELRDLAQFHGSGAEACFLNAIFTGPGLSAAEAVWRPRLEALTQPGTWLGVTALREHAGWNLKVVTPNPRQLRETVRAVRTALAPHLPYLAADLRKL
jgi:urease accessory protein